MVLLRRKVKKKYNIAVCLYGHMRTFDFCAPFLHRNLLRYYNYDMFIHSWSQLDYSMPTWCNAEKRSGLTDSAKIVEAYGDIKKLTIEEQIVEELGYTRFTYAAEARAYNIEPRAIDENADWFTEDPAEGRFSLFGIKSMFHSMASSVLAARDYMQQHNIAYDYILVTRPDVWIKQPFLIDNIMAKLPTDVTDRNILCSCFYGELPSIHHCIDLLILAKPNILIDCMENKDYVVNQLLTKSLSFDNPESVLIELLRYRNYGYQLLPLLAQVDFVVKRCDAGSGIS